MLLIADLAVVLTIAGLAAWLCQRAGLSVVVGYLIAGSIIGPFTPPFALVTDLGRVQTLAEIAVAQGSSAEALIGHLTSLAAEHLDDLVADGRITAEEKADMLAGMTDRITDLVNGEIDRPLLGGPGMGRGHRGGPMGGGMGGNGPCMDDDTELDEFGA